MRSLRILRFISFIRGLRVLVYALLTTFLISIIPFLVFLLIIVFVYGVVGYYVFGYRNSGDSERWGNLSRSMLSLITFVTVSLIIWPMKCVKKGQNVANFTPMMQRMPNLENSQLSMCH